MVFRAKGNRVWKLRVVDLQGHAATLTTGCVLESDAEDVERMVRRWQGREGKRHARPDVLRLLVSKHLGLPEAYDAALEGTLDELVAEAVVKADTVDLHPHVLAWHARQQGRKKGGRSANDYLRQLRTLFPASAPFAPTMLTRKEIVRRIDALTRKSKGEARVPVDAPTKNRYKAAVSSFCWYLVEQEVLETNPTRDIQGFGENRPRRVYYEREDAQKLIAGLPQPVAAASALMCATGAEWTAIRAMRAGDIDLSADPPAVRVRGTKTSDRDRVVPIVAENRWTVAYLRPALAGLLPDAPLFPRLTTVAVRYWQRKVAKALGLRAQGESEFGAHNLQDWRHTHAVQLLRDGYSDTIAAEHLGHANTDLVRKVYGVFKPTKHDYAKDRATTKLATKGRRNA